MRQVLFLLLIGVVVTASVATAKIWHVPDEYPTIQAGIDAAVDDDTVLVADGLYTGNGNRDIDFCGKSIVVASEHGPEATFINCEGGPVEPHRGFIFHSGEDSNSVLKGFRIRRGYVSGEWPEDCGGAIFCEESSPTIVGNVIIDNLAYSGGGIYCYYASPTIVGNTITTNTGAWGGGIHCQNSSPTISDNIITSNEGGGVHLYDAKPLIEGNTVAYNTSSRCGAGICCAHNSSATIIGNTFMENTADQCGGGMHVEHCSPTIQGNIIIGNASYQYGGGGISCYYGVLATIDGNIISGNTASANGGGIRCEYYSSPIIQRNTIVKNKAANGGGIHTYRASKPTFRGNTIADNVATNLGGGLCRIQYGTSTLHNCIFWGNRASEGNQIYISNCSIKVKYSDIESGWPGKGNIKGNPLFVLSEKSDYRLLWGSPCIDAGHPAFFDSDSTRSDMGAYPFDQSTPLTIYITPDTTVMRPPGELGVTYTLINIEPDPWTFFLRSDVTLPNGKPYPGNPVVGPMELTLPGGKNVQRSHTHWVPGFAPLGIYLYESKIYLSPDQLIDKDNVEIEMVLDSDSCQDGEGY